MKQLTCEICGSTDFIKQDGVFVCQTCGTKYSIEEAKKMMVEGTANTSGITVKVDTSDELANLYQVARRAKDTNNHEGAQKYYEMILLKDPFSWEAAFYTVYCKAMTCKIAEIQSAGVSIKNCIDTVLCLIRDHVKDKNAKIQAVQEMLSRCCEVCNFLFAAGVKHSSDYVLGTVSNDYVGMKGKQLIADCKPTIDSLYTLGDAIDNIFGSYEELHLSAASAWKAGIALHEDDKYAANIPFGQYDENRAIISNYVKKIQKYDSSYPSHNSSYARSTTSSGSSGGCYVATAVYGLYDCPQVWTLRRYRDYTLAETWYGRAFIRVYYAVSPTLVKWFGKCAWFKNLCKPRLDKMIESLNKNGIEDTPYEDRKW